MTAIGPEIAQSDYNDIARLSAAGDAARGLEQQDINDAIQRYNYEQNLPYLNLQNFGQMVSGDYGGSGTQTSMQPYYRSPLSNPIAGAGIGGLLGYGMTNSGYGAAGGAALGGLMGGK